MDINQSSLSRFKNNKTPTPRSNSEVKASSDTRRINKTPSSHLQELKQLDLKEGQILKGHVVDLRYNEVKIQIEPGRQIVSAKLTGDVTLSIGQEASFQVSDNSSDQLVLKYLPNDKATPTDSTILKALASSNLAATNVNKAIVSELLNHRLPVDKQTLQTLIKASYLNREASPLTLVLMFKHKIPMTSENIKQFVAYQNGRNQLISDINVLTKNISQLLQSPESSLLENPANQDTNQSDASAMIPSTQGKINQAVQINEKLLSILYRDSHNILDTNNNNIQNSLLNPEELAILGKAVDQKIREGSPLPTNLPTDLVQKLLNGNLSLDEAVNLLPYLTPQTDEAASPIIHKLLRQLAPQQDSPALLDQILSPAERSNLLEYIKTFPDPSDMKSQIDKGTATLSKLLNYIQESLTNTGGKEATQLLWSPEYHKLLEASFSQKWTITPDKLAKKAPVQELYENLQEDIEDIIQLTKLSREASESSSIHEPLKNIKENLTFMKDLNEVFTFLQLPVQIENRQLHSDLYVFTNKKALKEKGDQVSVLLHLDMNNLGSLSIHIQMNQKTILAKFYTEDNEAGQIIRNNIPLLEEALHNKGYQVHAELMKDYKKPDFCKDFIEENALDNSVKRYSFDVRT